MPPIITDEIIEEVKQAADIVEVVSDRVKLKRSGNGFTGLCPFHNEKTPSFHVAPHLGIYKCFGCGKAGNVFTFVMEQEGVDFPESVRLLANRYNILIPDNNQIDDPNRHEREGVYHALKFAAAFFHQQLRESEEANSARAYFAKRGLKRDFIKEYLLGYSPDSWHALAEAAQSASINESYLFKAGLLKESNTGRDSYDTFRGRVMFPIINTMGRVIAFGGRLMGVAKAAKYINSPQTIVYNKSEALYGIHAAKNEIRKFQETILVEGYMDVLQLHQAGIKNVVSTSGTAITPQQVAILHRYADRLIMIFDADSAGQNAMNRALPIALEEGLAVQVLTLPDGEDPDSFVKQFGNEGFKGYKKQHVTGFLNFLIEGEKKLNSWDDPRHKKQIVTRSLGLIAKIQDPIEREALIQQLHQLTFIGDRTLFQELNTILLSKERKERVDNKSNYSDWKQKKQEPFIPSLPDSSVEKKTTSSNESEISNSIDDIPPWLNDDIPLTDSPTTDPPDWNNYEDFGNDPLKSESKIEQNENKSDEKSAEIQTIAPKFEEELIRLMLIHGDELVAFISDHCTDEFFESDYCQTLFNDLKTRFIEQKDISINSYMQREHPFPMWVGQILFDRHAISGKGQKMLKANEDEILGKYRQAKSAMKSLSLNYCERMSNEIESELKFEVDSTKKLELTNALSEWVRSRSRILATSPDKLYPNPPWVK